MNASTVSRQSLTFFLITLFLPACGKPTTTPLELSGYNHTDQGIAWFSVNIPHGRGGNAGYVGPGTGGGTLSCCVYIPSRWTAGMSITVVSASVVNDVEKTAENVVSIPEYDSKIANTLNVHFLRNGSVKIFASRVMLGHRDYPLRGKEAELRRDVPLKILWP